LSRTINSIQDDLAKEYDIVELNVEKDENRALAKSYGLSSVPALVNASNGRVLIGGLYNASQIHSFLKGE
jgi:thioredoxin-like negative regulator of GroEL